MYIGVFWIQMNHLDGRILHLFYLLQLKSGNKCVIKQLKKQFWFYFKDGSWMSKLISQAIILLIKHQVLLVTLISFPFWDKQNSSGY